MSEYSAQSPSSSQNRWAPEGLACRLLGSRSRTQPSSLVSRSRSAATALSLAENACPWSVDAFASAVRDRVTLPSTFLMASGDASRLSVPKSDPCFGDIVGLDRCRVYVMRVN